VRVGIVGAGGIGRVHAEHLMAMDGVRVTAVMDAVAERTKELASACEARAYPTLEPLLEDVDVLYVCSPPTLHRAHVLAAASAGKHVFCEKPLATTLGDGRAIARAVEAAGIHAMVGFNNRFRPAFRRLRELARELGPAFLAWIVRMAPSTPRPNSNWRTTPGQLCGVTIESAAHDIDLVRWIMGDVVAASGRTATSLPELAAYDDTLQALLILESGRTASILLSWASAISMSSRGAIAAGGTISLLGPDMWTVEELRWAPSGGAERIERIDPAEGSDLGYGAETGHFIERLRQDRRPDVGIDDGLAALEVSDALLTSAAEGRTVALARSKG
jgi:myo-inositol 2-dehydrogenase/D-chiro-inositol 1-dehydrogenase